MIVIVKGIIVEWGMNDLLNSNNNKSPCGTQSAMCHPTPFALVGEGR